MVLEQVKIKLKESIDFANRVKETPHKHVSFSQFSMYSQCPKKWFLSYVLKLGTRPPSIHMTFGTAFHEVLQEYLTENHDITSKSKVDFNIELKNKIKEIYKRDFSNYGKHFSTSSELTEFWEQGVKILEHIRSSHNLYYDRDKWTLLGVEVPLMIKILDSEEPLYFILFIDLLFYDKENNRLVIDDIKTSGKGWSSYSKKDKIKTSQVLLYKSFLAKSLGIDSQDIDCRFTIVRRITDGYDYPVSRVQIFKPSQAKKSVEHSINQFKTFIKKVFDKQGNARTDINYPALSGNNCFNCNYCEFKDRFDLCPEEDRDYTNKL
jgi:hypothetical protein